MTTFKTLALCAIALAPTTAAADWSGFYLGAGVNTLIDGEIAANGNTITLENHNPAAFFLGYNAQNGGFVWGVEYAYSQANDVESEDNDGTADVGYGDLKLRGGYDFGQLHTYAALGRSAIVVRNEANTEITSSGISYGVGVDFAINPNFIVGAEYLQRDLTGEFTNGGFGDDIDVDASTIGLRAAFKF